MLWLLPRRSNKESATQMRCRFWRTKALLAIALLTLGLCPNTLKAQATPGAHKQLQKITFSYPAISMTWLPLKVAVDKGFFADEGLEPNLIFMRGNLGTVALSNGDIDFVLNITSALQGALQGLGLKLVAALNTRPLFSLVVRPEIKTIADLKDKIFAVNA